MTAAVIGVAEAIASVLICLLVVSGLVILIGGGIVLYAIEYGTIDIEEIKTLWKMWLERPRKEKKNKEKW